MLELLKYTAPPMCRSVQVKVDRPISKKVSLFNSYRSVYISTLTCVCELKVVIEKNEVTDTGDGNELPPKGKGLLEME